jgi:hypothetical protein
MSRVARVLLVVLGGLIGGWAGYWIGHPAGWAADATWPRHAEGGTGAALLSIGLAVAGVLVVEVALTPAAHRRK